MLGKCFYPQSYIPSPYFYLIDSFEVAWNSRDFIGLEFSILSSQAPQ